MIVSPSRLQREPVAPNGKMPMLTQFNQRHFFQRLHQTILQTNQYDQTVPQVWGKILSENAGRKVPAHPVLQGASDPAPRHVEQLVHRIRNAHITTVVLEAAHAYMFQSMDDPDFVRSMELQYADARRLTVLLEQQRIRVQRVLFVDNYNPNPATGAHDENLDVDAYLSLAEENGFPPDYLMWEADMAPLARSMVEYMHRFQSLVSEKESASGDDGITPSEANRKLLLGYRGVELMSLDQGKMSCASLDAALSIIKYAYLGQGIVNVLPRRQNEREFSFKGQQKKVRQILMDHFGVRVMPFFNIFTSESQSLPHSSGAHHALRKKTA